MTFEHLENQLAHKKQKMDIVPDTPEIPTPNANHNSYQNLIEGKLEVIVSNPEKTHYLNVSELLRDLYQKVYNIQGELAKKPISDPQVSEK